MIVIFFWILGILRNVSNWNFINTETPAQVFPVIFSKFLKRPVLQNICQWLLLIIRSLLDSFVRCIVLDNCLLKKSMYLFNVFKKSKDNYYITAIMTCLGTTPVFSKTLIFQNSKYLLHRPKEICMFAVTRPSLLKKC